MIIRKREVQYMGGDSTMAKVGSMNGWMTERIKMTIDQHFQESRNVTDKKYLEEHRTHFIGGILQTALHLLPLDRYMECKNYCYEKYGYDPGGCREQQMSVLELVGILENE